MTAGFDVVGVFGIRVFAQIMQRERDLFDGAVEIADAAGFKFFGVFGIEHQIPFVFGQLLRSPRLFEPVFC